MKLDSTPSQIVFFDGTCNLCNGFIDFIVRADKRQLIKIASLQGETAAKLLSAETCKQLSSVILYDRAQLYFESEAILRSLEWLGPPWSFFKVFRYLPVKWSNAVYRYVARNRYTWFGRRNTCRLPTPKEREYFLP